MSADFNTMEVTKSFSGKGLLCCRPDLAGNSSRLTPACCSFNSPLLAHTHRVADMHCDEANNWLISCGQDKYAVVCDLTSGKRLSTYALHGWGSALQYDQASNNVFVGDYSGKINVLKVSLERSRNRTGAYLQATSALSILEQVREGKISLVSVLEGHSGELSFRSAFQSL